MRPYRKFILITASVLAVSAFAAAPSEAQRRFHPRSRIYIGGYFGYPYYSPFWGPYWAGYYPWSWWGPYWPQAYPPAWGDRDYDRTIGIRTDIQPRETQIYVDGYFSGTASDFNGAFKRLRVPEGQHEIVLYLKGYKTVRQSLDLKPGSDYRVKQKLQPLAAGESQEAPPSPPPQAQRSNEPEDRGNPQIPAPNEPYGARARAPREREAGRVQAQGFGSLSVRVQPAGAEVLVDGERWQGPETDGPLVVQLAEGRHRIEIRKEGYVTFSTEVQVRQGETAPLNVSLPQAR